MSCQVLLHSNVHPCDFRPFLVLLNILRERFHFVHSHKDIIIACTPFHFLFPKEIWFARFRLWWSGKPSCSDCRGEGGEDGISLHQLLLIASSHQLLLNQQQPNQQQQHQFQKRATTSKNRISPVSSDLTVFPCNNHNISNNNSKYKKKKKQPQDQHKL